MKEKIIIEGMWRIEGGDKDSHFGTLTYDPSRGLVLVVKTLKEIDSDKKFFKMPSVPKTIFGLDKNNFPVSLYGCFVTSHEPHSNLHSYTIFAHFGVHGEEVLTLDKVCCKHLITRISLLDNWLDRSNYKTKYSPQFELIQKPDEFIECEINSEATIVITPAVGSRPGKSKIVFDDGKFLEFKFLNEIPVREILNKYVYQFCRFLTMMTGEPAFINETYFFRGDKKPQNQITLYYQNSRNESANRKNNFPVWLVRYHDISENFSNTVKLWYELEDSLGDVLNLYFATTLFPNQYTRQIFLFLAQALEVYHRKNPKNKLAHVHKKPLEQRLEEIIKPHRTEVEKFITDIDKFSKSILYARNQYTHYDTDKEDMKHVADGFDLVELNVKMRAILEICIFSDLEISDKPFDRIIQNVYRYTLSEF